MKHHWIKLTTALILMVSTDVWATTFESYSRNRDGIAKLQQKSYFPAFQEFLKALDNDPLNPEVHLNIALALEANQEYEKAEQAYKGVLKLLPENSTRRFEALFNLAGVQGKMRKIGEALATYQAALEMDPDSIEVKANIELLWNQGEGDGEGDPKKEDSKDGKGKPQEQEQKQDDKPEQKKKPQPKPFQSQNLTPQDVKKILDEIKNQEQGIRAQEYDKGPKEGSRGKDW